MFILTRIDHVRTQNRSVSTVSTLAYPQSISIPIDQREYFLSFKVSVQKIVDRSLGQSYSVLLSHTLSL